MKSFEKRTYFFVEYNDLENLIHSVYGISYEIACQEEKNNYTSMFCDISKEEFDNYDKEVLRRFLLKEDPMYALKAILTDLCIKEHIPEGPYLINISW